MISNESAHNLTIIASYPGYPNEAPPPPPPPLWVQILHIIIFFMPEILLGISILSIILTIHFSPEVKIAIKSFFKRKAKGSL
ncbi:hypothetical protein [Acidianus manzaensis]|uniref:Uncharacterized protein n=1 Tax=Acidianus manzaensis TaxID=282676 RepID=A0A1W6K1M7_9CREN|nr:hypothetical protein [Acidianus manzaensis]ARM76397.1 hypothetical protein B6F84_10450 [Acidianus manzaensis]